MPLIAIQRPGIFIVMLTLTHTHGYALVEYV